jgi:hypothetical protein
VVVVFPLVPVIQILNELEYLLANSISENICIQDDLIFEIIYEELDIPGLLITRSDNLIFSKE